MSASRNKNLEGIPKGIVEAEYSRTGDGFEAVISLPKGVSGELVWKAKKFAIHEGRQAVALPQ